ncbi:DUF6351 family protein [Ramlibacter sp. XY19]|uniref:DUF6351 family protein n=1 Tax=Ramlibacter paludis TaxID=2908000 RepID=UPI0023DACD80|nr:DUF6351 family protein [Ramlibacter paludis]
MASPSRRRPGRAPWWFGAVALASMVLAACGGGGGSDLPPLQLQTLSTRADLVSDGNVLMEVIPPAGSSASALKVTVNGTDQSSAFVRGSDGRITGVVTGLAVGENVILANSGDAFGARLVVTNAPRSGPVISGAQPTPFYCATPTAQPASGNAPATNASGLSGQPDANCNIATEYKLYYRTTAAGCSTALPDTSTAANLCFKPYDPAAAAPADLASTTTSDGVTVPFVVRVERGTMNRGIYDIAVLFDPSKPWTANAPQAQWNRKIWYSFGSSTGQPRRQSRTTVNWSTLTEQLKRGYLVVQNSMTDSSRNSNRVLMAEVTMMMKEHIIDTYGRVKYTLGTGCSGGSINSNMNLSIMPGTLDGVITTCTYPDSETTSMEVGDCTLLAEAYRKNEVLGLWTTMGLTQDQINARKAAINGHVDQTACHAWMNLFGSNGKAGLYQMRTVTDNVTGAITQSTTFTNNCELPNSAVYDPANPVATASLPRCNAWSWAESIWGKVAGSPAARDTRDNVGVQYGLKALLAGKITPEEFVTLNEAVGGIDRDSTPRAARSTADAEALDIAYRSGIVASGRNLAKAAIIDMRGWDDSLLAANLPPGTPVSTGIHHQWYSFAIRDRIARDAGDANNQALWRFARGNFSIPPGTMLTDGITAMDEWLNALVTSSSTATLEAKVRATRPASTADFCYLPDDATQSVKVTGAACDNPATAAKYLIPSLSPRQVAGGPRSEDVLKCQLKPLAASDYTGVTFSASQLARLNSVFGTGVCDWSKPGVGQQAAVSPLTFKAGPGGVPLGADPVSTKQ